MARPTKEESAVIKQRNYLIKYALSLGIIQADVARIFRIPRNTVSNISRRKLPVV